MQQEERYETRESATMQKVGQMGFVIASLKNISHGGVCLEWANESFHLAKGDLVNLTINLNQIGKKYSLSGRVVWKVGRRSGVQFMSSEQVMKELLSKAVGRQ